MDTTLPTSKSDLASLSFSASSAVLNECEVPYETGSFKINLTAFGFGVSCISAIFGIFLKTFDAKSKYKVYKSLHFSQHYNVLFPIFAFETRPIKPSSVRKAKEIIIIWRFEREK